MRMETGIIIRMARLTHRTQVYANTITPGGM